MLLCSFQDTAAKWATALCNLAVTLSLQFIQIVHHLSKWSCFLWCISFSPHSTCQSPYLIKNGAINEWVSLYLNVNVSGWCCPSALEEIPETQSWIHICLIKIYIYMCVCVCVCVCLCVCVCVSKGSQTLFVLKAWLIPLVQIALDL